MINLADLEAAIRNAVPVAHLEIEDQSSGCGENYAIVLVSEAFEGKNTLARHRFGEFSFFRILRRIITALSPVNDILKAQISQMHAFSQVCFKLALLVTLTSIEQKTFTPKQYQDYLAKEG